MSQKADGNRGGSDIAVHDIQRPSSGRRAFFHRVIEGTAVELSVRAVIALLVLVVVGLLALLGLTGGLASRHSPPKSEAYSIPVGGFYAAFGGEVHFTLTRVYKLPSGEPAVDYVVSRSAEDIPPANENAQQVASIVDYAGYRFEVQRIELDNETAVLSVTPRSS